MNKQTEHKIAREIVMLFKLIILGTMLTFSFYLAIYAIYFPPVHPLIDYPEIDRFYDQEYTRSSIINPEDFLKNRSAYDNEVMQYCFSGFCTNCVNEARAYFFNLDVKTKTKYAAAIIFGVLIFGRYLLLFIRWVERASKEQPVE